MLRASRRTVFLLSLLAGGAVALRRLVLLRRLAGRDAIWAAAFLLDARAGAPRRELRVIAAALLLALTGLTKVT